MKNPLWHVILSAAKNRRPTTPRLRSTEILRCAQNDMSGPVFSGKLYERAQFHIRRARSLRARLDELCLQAQVEQLQRAAEQEHRKHYPRLTDMRLNTIWLSLYGLIGALGIVYTVICLVR